MPTKKSANFNTLRILKDWRLLLYNFAIVLSSPYLLLTKVHRRYSKKRTSEFLWERWKAPLYGGEAGNHKKPHIVFIAMGFGEKQTAEQLSKSLKAIYPEIRITWALKEENGVKNVRRTNPSQSITYIPFDFWPAVSKWLKVLNPDIVVSVEKLWIPNIVWGSRLYGAAVCVISGRTARYKPEGWKLWQIINQWSLRGFNSIGLISEEEKQKLQLALPADNPPSITGTTKMSLHPEESTANHADLERWLQACNKSNLPLLAAGSIHRGDEEELIIQAYKKVHSCFPCVLLFAPRRLDRINEILDLFRKHDLTVSQRSKFVAGADSTCSQANVLLLDSIGELAFAYKFAQAAYVGGTLKAPGHNVLEPVEWGVPVFFGTGTRNVPVTQKIVLQAEVGYRIHSSHELATHWRRVLQDKDLRESLRQRCDLVIAEQNQALKNNLQVITDLIDSHC
jgi:3-deoxy-D-manno-octulosonic-acid transferase